MKTEINPKEGKKFLAAIQKQVKYIRENPQDIAVRLNFQENDLEYIEFLLARVKV